MRSGSDDIQIVERFKNGDVSAFEDLILKYQNRIYNLCRHMLGDARDAEDAAQDTFIKAYRNLNKFRPGDRMSDILALPDVHKRIQDNKHYLVYFLPRDYIMQGMIADTGGQWKLYEQHHSISMITDWIFHPFRHLREGHHAMHGGMHPMHQNGSGMGDGVVRRLIFLSIEDVKVKSPADLFSINALRVPQFMVDVDAHNLKLIDIKDLPHGSGWGTVPTPVF